MGLSWHYSLVKVEDSGGNYLVTVKRRKRNCCRVLVRSAVEELFYGNIDNWKPYGDAAMTPALNRWLNVVIARHQRKNK